MLMSSKHLVQQGAESIHPKKMSESMCSSGKTENFLGNKLNEESLAFTLYVVPIYYCHS